MPIPKPRKGEKKEDFIKRCMGDEVMKREYPNNRQRFAICNSQINKNKGKEEGNLMAFRHNSKTADREPPWSDVDKTALPRLAFADMGEEGKKSTWKFPHHWVKGGTKKDDDGIWTDGELYLHLGGLKAAWAAANGARSGKKASQEVINHLQAHRNTVKSSATGALVADPWLISPEWLQTIYDIAMRNGDPDALAAYQGETITDGIEYRDGAAIINVIGPIFRYANLFTEISGATSTSKLATHITKASKDPNVKKIILNFDSPGGQVTGINELSKMIKKISEEKPVIAYVDGSAASAAYWLASSATEIVADETALVGSIGVVATFRRKTNSDEIEIVSSNAPKKRPDITTQEGQDEVKKTLDAIADVFVEAVAENRGVTKDYVLKNFGQGGVLVGKNALAVGMIDRIDSFENLLKGGKKMEITKEMLMEKHPDIVDAIRKEAEAKVKQLKLKIFAKDITSKVGDELATKLIPLYEKVDEDTINAIVDEFMRLQAVIKDLGKQQGSESVEEPKTKDTDDIDMKEVQKLADEKGISLTDAYVEYMKIRRE